MKCIDCKRNNIDDSRRTAMDKRIPVGKNTKELQDDLCASCLDKQVLPVVVPKVKRKCRKCNVILPLDRYFTCLEHAPEHEDPGIYVYS